LHVDLLKLFCELSSPEKCLLPVRKENIVKRFFTIAFPVHPVIILYKNKISREKNLWKKGNPIFLPKARLKLPVKDGLMMKQGYKKVIQ